MPKLVKTSELMQMSIFCRDAQVGRLHQIGRLYAECTETTDIGTDTDNTILNSLR